MPRVDTHWAACIALLLISCGAPPSATHPRALAATPTKPAAARKPATLPLAALAGLDDMADLARHVSDVRVAARQLVARRLAQLGGRAAVPLLTTLARDADPKVRVWALWGLGTLEHPAGRQQLQRELMARAGREHAERVEVMADQVGGEGLMALLSWLPSTDPERWSYQKAVFDAVDRLADPRASDALHGFLQSRPHAHFSYRAALALANLGDVRAVPFLAERLRHSAAQLYVGSSDWEQLLQRYGGERVAVARVLGDLADLHPGQRPWLREQTERPLLAWLEDRPTPHANGLRALAKLESPLVLSQLRGWSQPQVPLPREGAQPPMPEEWVVAGVAQRYLGTLRDAPSLSTLLRALTARPKHADVTTEALMEGGVAIMGMCLISLGKGAAQGLAEWGEPKALVPLLDYVHSTRDNEQARTAACKALPWVAAAGDGPRLVQAALRYSNPSKQDLFRRQCLLEGLARRQLELDPEPLVALLLDPEVIPYRQAAARAVAKAGLSPALEQRLLEARVEGAKLEVLLAVLLGGSNAGANEIAQRTASDAVLQAELEKALTHSLEFVSHEMLEHGELFRVMDNADAIAQAQQPWAKHALQAALGGLVYDNGPHSLTRVVLRYRLLALAKKPGPRQRQALRALFYMGEKGTLMALSQDPNSDRVYAQAQLDELRQSPSPTPESASAHEARGRSAARQPSPHGGTRLE